MKGVTKGIIERYEYGSKADELKKEFNSVYQEYRKLKREFVFEDDIKVKKIINNKIKIKDKQMKALKAKIEILIKK